MQMKTMTASMAVLAALMLAASSLPAAAQERGEGRRHGGEGREEFRRDGVRPDRSGERRAPRAWGEQNRAPEARPAPQAAEPPRAPEAPRAPRARRAGDGGQDMWRNDRDRRGPDMRRPGRWVDNDGDDLSNPSAADRADREDRREARDARRWNGGDVQWDGRDLRYGDRERRDRGRDARDGRGRDGDRGGWDGRWSREDRDRWDRSDRDRDRRRGDRAYWSRGRYPFSYHSPRRFRGPGWVAPSGFHMRAWSHGDYLPWGWYGASYRLNDWSSYGLPWPPPGFDWVRVGPDVLLVDRFNGRIVQVVRMVFW